MSNNNDITDISDVKSELDLFDLDDLEELTLDSNLNNSESNSLDSNNVKKIVLEIDDSDEDNKLFFKNKRKRDYNFFNDSLDNED